MTHHENTADDGQEGDCECHDEQDVTDFRVRHDDPLSDFRALHRPNTEEASASLLKDDHQVPIRQEIRRTQAYVDRMSVIDP